jgi:LPS-assembly protein
MRLKPKYLLILAIWPALTYAEPDKTSPDEGLLCPSSNNLSNPYIAPETFNEQQKDETRISAEKVENAAGDITTFSGNVLIERSQLRLQADKVTFNRPDQLLNLDGQIHIDANNLAINGDTGWLNLKDNSGEFKNSHYFLPESRFQGNTPTLSLTKNKQTLLIDSHFSSCPPSEKAGGEDWYLHTTYLKLDHEEQLGTAKHAVLWFKNIPIFYSPYISFPLGDERRSGFLMPSFGSSSSRGAEISVPWYWSIAPNHDVLFTPRYMKKRGTQLNTNYRYLSHSSNGQLDIEYLDKDQLLKESRHLLKFKNHSDLGGQVDFDITASDASDNEYFDDLGAGIDITNTTHLERTATLKYFNGPWTLSSLAQTYETIDEDIVPANRPYRRLPQITLTGKDNFFDSDIEWSVDSEWVDFEHEDTSITGNKTIGSRFDIYPKLSWPLQGSAWFVTPSFGVRHSQYDVTDSGGTKLIIEDRNLSVASLDTGLFFERELNNNKTIQTLEPRLFYLHVPFEDQSSLPIFDTGEYDFTFAQLFRDNRFTGIDRIADSNQFTLALTSRFLNKENGAEFLSMSIGQIFYNEDRKVNLTNTIETETKSDIVSEISNHWNNWSSRASVQWNPDQNKTDKSSAQIHYQDEGNRIFNIGYRFRRDFADETNNLEQTDIAISWPLNHQYSLVGKWNYSITEERDIETLFGIEYESCCWAMRIVAQRYLQDPDNTEPYNSSVMFQLILKGLGSVAHKETTDVLKRAILGYQSDY